MSGVELELNKVTAPIQLHSAETNNKTDEQIPQIAASNATEQKPDSFEKTQEIHQTSIKEKEIKNLDRGSCHPRSGCGSLAECRIEGQYRRREYTGRFRPI